MALEDAKTQVDHAFTRQDLKGLSNENTFGGATSFARRRYSKDLSGVDIAVTGIPFDQAVTNRTGTRLGPRAIREASSLQSPDAPYGWGYDPLSELNIVDYGDLAFDYAMVSEFPSTLQAHIKGILDAGAASVCLGGDHYISFPILKAYVEKFGPLSLLQFDAHSDTWADDNMDRIDHGTMFYKAVKLGLIDPARSVQVGIRTENPDTMGFNIIDAREVHLSGPVAVAEKIMGILGHNPTYVTFDIDGLDPAYAPGTGTPVWGGLTSAQASIILRDLAGINMVGGDVVEVSPPFDTTGATAIAGAHVAMGIDLPLGLEQTGKVDDSGGSISGTVKRRRMIWLSAFLLCVASALAWVRLAPSDPERWHKMPEIVETNVLAGGASHVLEDSADKFAQLDRVIRATPRTQVLAGTVEEGMITYVTRSLLFGFPDYTTVRAQDGRLEIYSRLRFGRSDLGVNAARIDRLASDSVARRMTGSRRKFHATWVHSTTSGTVP